MNKKLAIVGLSLGLTAGGVAGFALGTPSISNAVAQSTETTVADASAATDAGRPDPSARLAEILAPLVSDGTITQEQADRVIATLVEAGPIGRGHGDRIGKGVEAAATALGLTVDELRAELADGSTVAEVAAEKGVEVQTVVDAVVADATERINARVADGSLTQEQADTRLAELNERVTAMVNGEGGFGRGGRDGHGPGGRGEAAENADDSTSTTTS